jgi:hypothetical protein
MLETSLPSIASLREVKRDSVSSFNFAVLASAREVLRVSSLIARIAEVRTVRSVCCRNCLLISSHKLSYACLSAFGHCRFVPISLPKSYACRGRD